MAKLRLVVTTRNAMLPELPIATLGKFRFGARLWVLIRGIITGARMNAQVDVSVDSVPATGTLTLSANPAAADTVTVNGVVFTAVVSGATGNQFNIGATITATAANIAAVVNASVTAGIPGVVTATSAVGVVTFSSVAPGRVGNNIPLAKVMANGTVSGAVFTGGLDANLVTYNYGAPLAS